MAKVSPNFLFSAIIVGGVLGLIGLFTTGFVMGLLGYQGGVSNAVAYGICFAIMVPVVFVLVISRRRALETPPAPPPETGP